MWLSSRQSAHVVYFCIYSHIHFFRRRFQAQRYSCICAYMCVSRQGCADVPNERNALNRTDSCPCLYNKSLECSSALHPCFTYCGTVQPCCLPSSPCLIVIIRCAFIFYLYYRLQFICILFS